jgi:toxin ParE1/3/4
VSPFRFHPEARLEVRAAAAWYRERSREAARGFVAVIDEGIQAVREHPGAWPTWRGREDVRRRSVRRFPYSIIYAVEGDAVVILAIAHHRRRPGYWLPRVGR